MIFFQSGWEVTLFSQANTVKIFFKFLLILTNVWHIYQDKYLGDHLKLADKNRKEGMVPKWKRLDSPAERGMP